MADHLDDFYTPKHKRLDWIGSIAGFFSWIVLALFTLSFVANLNNALDFMAINNIRDGFRSFPLETINVFARVVITFFQGVVFFLLLRAITSGLNMIVETDLNYRERNPGGSHG
jgi:hypothetical protein